MHAHLSRHAVQLSIRLLLALVGALALLVPIAAPTVQAAQGDQGTQGGWAIDDAGDTDFVHGVRRQLPMMRDAGAGWVRINFRLGGCFSDWTSVGCNGRTALDKYDAVVDAARANNLRVLGLISNESWPGGQADWTANSAEVHGGSGDNGYVRGFAQRAAGVLAAHFAGRVSEWEVWNEPNAWTSLDGGGNPTGGSYLWPSNFAWLLARSHAAIKAARPDAAVIAGGVLGHDLGGYTTTRLVGGVPTRVTLRGERRGARPPVSLPERGISSDSCHEAQSSGAVYLCDTYLMGIARAGWRGGAYPLDGIGQHLYVDQGGATSEGKLATYFEDLRAAYARFEGAGTGKRTHVTEIGWTTASVSPDAQAGNVRTLYTAVRANGYVARAYWFAVQDISEANLYYGLTNGDGGAKPSFGAFQQAAVSPPTPPPPPPASCSPRPRVVVQTARTGDGRLHVTVAASGANNWLRSVWFGRATNALVDAGSIVGAPGGAMLPLPDGTPSFGFFVRRAGAGPATVQVVVTDRCGDWPTFVGGGSSAF